MPAAPTPLTARPTMRVMTLCAPPQMALPTSKMRTAVTRDHSASGMRMNRQLARSLARSGSRGGRGRTGGVDAQDLAPPQDGGSLSQDERRRDPALLRKCVEI